MFFLLALTILLNQFCYACPSNCDSCVQSNTCTTCASGYALSSDESSCDINGTSSTVIIIVVCNLVVFLMFIVGYCCYRRFCKNKPTQQPSNAQVAAAITQADLNRQPSVKDTLWKNIKSNEKSFHLQSCTICLNTQVNVKTDCGHGFHNICIKRWFQTKAACPTCRTDIASILLFCNICYRKSRRLQLKEVKNDLQEVTSCNNCLLRFK